MSNFAFLQPEWSTLYAAANKAEAMANTDARTSCFYARRTLELAVDWLYKHDPALRLPYQDHLSALIHEPTFLDTAGDSVFNKASCDTKSSVTPFKEKLECAPQLPCTSTATPSARLP